MMHQPRILFLDAYDSFSNNITSQLVTVLDSGCSISVLPIDADLSPAQFSQELSRYDAVVCGPGPGSPGNAADVGLMRNVFAGTSTVAADVPVLGICLGFQVLVRAFGGTVERLGRGLHGMVHEIEHVGSQPLVEEKDIFESVPPFSATLYHSLHANNGQASLAPESWTAARWQPSASCPDLVPLAWSSSKHDRRILMAVRHASRPFWAVQYHPESVCTDEAGAQVLKNWFVAARKWNAQHRPQWWMSEVPRDISQQDVTAQLLTTRRESLLGAMRRTGRLAPAGSVTPPAHGYMSRTMTLPRHITPPDLVEILDANYRDKEHIILDSSSAHSQRQGDATKDQMSRFSIVAMDVERAVRISHQAATRTVTVRKPALAESETEVEVINLREDEDVWAVLSRFWAQRKLTINTDDGVEIPFRGGFMGYLTYEMGLSGIGVDHVGQRKERHDDFGDQKADLCFVWVRRSLVLDHIEGRLVVQSLGAGGNLEEDDIDWVNGIVSKLEASERWSDSALATTTTTPPLFPAVDITTPDSARYQALVCQCQEYIAAGDSYELCLTAQTKILPRVQTPSVPPSAWQLYKTLRSCQPAPFGSFLKLNTDGSPTLVSSSPERFLSFSASGLCRMHPMKGTVRKVSALLDGTLHKVSRAEAEAILQTPKERAENLMIVDLVRHDLHGVCGAGRVNVPVLMRVEEYASVFQMVTVVEGDLKKPLGETDDSRHDGTNEVDETYTGLDVLSAALPPGSMTGAPKKRSCEILLGLEEHKPRSLYSGVVGYMDVTGRGDWSVTIRSFFKWGGDDATEWTIGAGGAVTGLSSPLGEWEEMMAKLSGPLGVFGGGQAT